MEISNIKELEDYVKNGKFIKRRINDFIKFRKEDYDILNGIIHNTQYVTHSELMNDKLKVIFKYVSKTQLNYWLVRGWDEIDAKKKVSELQSKLATLMMAKRFSTSDYKKITNTCIEYWLEKGYPLDIAKQKLKERQATFTLEKCIQKYGKEQGEKRHKERQIKWINSLYGKMNEDERIAFESSKMSELGKASGGSLKVFLPVIDYFQFKREEYYLGVDNKKEYCLYCKESNGVFFYDFVIPSLKIIIEFNGHVWHPNGDDWKPLDFVNETKENLELKQNFKRDTAIKHGFHYLEIWDIDSSDINIKKCIDFIKLYEHPNSNVFEAL